jgi:hypothetical protein
MFDTSPPVAFKAPPAEVLDLGNPDAKLEDLNLEYAMVISLI